MGGGGGTFDAPSLANAVGNQPKPGSFAAQLAAKKNQNSGMGTGSAAGGGGLFKKY